MTAWDDVVQAVQAALTGERDEGRAGLETCWASTTPDDHAQRCVIAHYLADLQTDLDDEIRWDETALVVAAMMRTSTGMASRPPTRWMLFS